jgi:hypothetical protein
MVSVGFAAPPEGNTDEPQTKTLSVPWIIKCGSTTPSPGDAVMRQVPM